MRVTTRDFSANSLAKKRASGFRPGIGFVALLGMLFGAGTGYLPGAGWEGIWHDGLVDSGGGAVGAGHALCIDAAGRPRFAYTMLGDAIIRYAAWTGSAWKYSKIADASGQPENISMALSSSGTPHVAYFDYANKQIIYAVYNGATWSRQVIDGSENIQCGEQNAIAVDNKNRPHILYTVYKDDTMDWGLKYASWNGKAWILTTISWNDPSADVLDDYAISLAIDRTGRAHAVYNCFDSQDSYQNIVMYATSTNGTAWSTTAIDRSSDDFGSTCLSLDSAGNPCVAVPRLPWGAAAELRYTKFSAGSWTRAATIAPGVPPTFMGFMVSGNGSPAAAYGDMSLKLVFGAQVGKAWITETVKKTGTTGSGWCRLALGPDGRAFLSYYYIDPILNRSELRLAQAAPGLWPGVSLPVALDRSGKWQTGGSQSWLGQTTETHDGADAARPDILGHNQSSWLSITVQGPAKLSFWWKTSSERGDKLRFYLDATAKATLSGISVWKPKTFNIGAGSHVVKWMFNRDASGSAGLDTGFVDQVKITK
jgi:hypothetical protein